MKTQQIEIAEAWTNDYLDLYNFAGQLGDLEWQNEILSNLKVAKIEIQKEVYAKKREDLWQKFDFINQELLALYQEIHQTNLENEVEKLQNKVWELKLQRILISKEIYS
ncbi:hypothetical protein EHS13_25500 [Paenibacillus psychroresistens]|uniref:Uncharacterized protein n=1 Tax=Paenibacillus psychroresistens TaxID=1778678 RepID=A0A6B8RRY1_9BACL|nr:hypothetical protein [Paenibacillus psychroresistens]QGQ98008.1 hypothetical protein EHS13_25500 [Paenibacillus psychroresistens]